jgi:hypothetical protein
MDPHHFGQPDCNPDPQQSEKPNLDPYQSSNSGAVEAENRAIEAHPVAVTGDYGGCSTTQHLALLIFLENI